ncbi:MAG: hypothetical protein A2Y25_05555 [Candidatus Melainabacteria bacterium GWF2_37_15]|nr:MAG: hypothetical protein A2Y25_05555 [Candidatus Melainabacteria bacterium GWF2_37_15]
MTKINPVNTRIVKGSSRVSSNRRDIGARIADCYASMEKANPTKPVAEAATEEVAKWGKGKIALVIAGVAAVVGGAYAYFNSKKDKQNVQ